MKFLFFKRAGIDSLPPYNRTILTYFFFMEKKIFLLLLPYSYLANFAYLEHQIAFGQGMKVGLCLWWGR